MIKSVAKITLQQYDTGLFAVICGNQVDGDLNYDEATKKLGEALMHDMVNRGVIHKREKQ